MKYVIMSLCTEIFASVTTCRPGPLNEANKEREKGERKGKRRGKEKKGEGKRGKEKEEGVTVCIPGYGWLRLSVWT